MAAPTTSPSGPTSPSPPANASSPRRARAAASSGTAAPSTARCSGPRSTPPTPPPLTRTSGATSPTCGRCYAYTGDARRAVTGQALRDGSSTTFEGDGAAPLQIFSVDADLVSGIGGGPTDISFTGIPDGATVLVNVYGDTRTLDSDAVTLPDPDQRRRLLWNFPTPPPSP